jgi:hypothetical protein
MNVTLSLGIRFFTTAYLTCMTIILYAAEAPKNEADHTWGIEGKLISDDLYNQAVDEISPELKLIRSLKAIRPPFGLLISNVKQPSQASAAGISAGDVITHVGGFLLPEKNSFNELRDKNKPQAITFWTSSNGIRDVTFKHGLIGVTYAFYNEPIYGYLATPEIGATWENDLLIAAFACFRRQDVAQRALLEAGKKGCLHPTWFAVAAHLSLKIGRFEDAIKYAEIALNKVLANEQMPLAKTSYTAALASGNPDLAQRINSKYKVMAYDQYQTQWKEILEGAIPQFKTISKANTLLPWDELRSPKIQDVVYDRKLVYLAAQQQLMLSKKSKASNDEKIVQGQENCNQLNRDGFISYQLPPTQFDFIRMGPILRDVDASLTGEMFRPFGENDGFVRVPRGYYQLRLADHSKAGSPLVAMVRVALNSEIEVAVHDLPLYVINRRELNVYSPIRIEIFLRGTTLGILVDGLPVYYGPTTTDSLKRQLGLDVSIRDMAGTLKDIRWRGVPTDQTLPVPPINVVPPVIPLPGANDF